MGQYRIGDVVVQLGLSADTLRYYEKIGLLAKVGRSASRLRLYDDKHLSQLRFIQRAQAMDFSLAEIAQLLEMRASPRRARPKVRELTRNKLDQVSTRLADLKTLRNELQLLLNLCRGDSEGCPIVAGIEHKPQATLQRKAPRRPQR